MVAIQCLLQRHSPLGKPCMWVVLKRNEYSYLPNYSELKVSGWDGMLCLLMQWSSLFEPTVRISWGKNVECTCQGAQSLAGLPSRAFRKSFVVLMFSERVLRCTCVWRGRQESVLFQHLDPWVLYSGASAFTFGPSQCCPSPHPRSQPRLDLNFLSSGG